MKKVLIFFLVLILLLTSCSVQTEQNSDLGSGSSHLQKSISSSVPVFVVIHLEPGIDSHSTAYPETYWPDLVKLVALADAYDIKLTLEFNPQWATYILADSEKLALVRSWEAEGHELAVHHHGPHHGESWNGYTHEQEYISDPQYVGTITTMMDLLNQLPVSGKMVTGGISVDEDKDADWPEGIIYGTDGGINGVDDLLSIPSLEEYNGHSIMSLSHAQYATGKLGISLEDIQSGLDSAQEGQVLGIVFHDKNYAADPGDIRSLFELLEDNNVSVQTVSQILT